MEPKRGCGKVLPTLPHDVLERKIFSVLPFTQVQAITILSKSFRCAWKFCHHLSLDENLFRRVSEKRYKAIVSDAIYGHSGVDALTFELYYDPVGSEDVIKTWLCKLDELGFRDIYLYLCPEDLRRQPGVDPNLSPNLLNLTLQGITISQQLIDGIFAACNSLQSLKVINCQNKDASLPFRAQNSQNLREIIFERTRLHSIFIDSPPSLTWLRFYKENFSVMLKVVPPLLADDSIIHSYNRLSNSVDSNLWLASEVSSGGLLLPKLAIKGVIPPPTNPTTTVVPMVTAEEYFTHAPLWDPRRLHIHYPLWNVEEFHYHSMNGFVDYSGIIMFLLRCRLIKKVDIHFTRGLEQEWIESEVMSNDLDGALDMPIEFQHLHYVKITGMLKIMEHLELVVFFVQTAERCLRDFIVIEGEDDACRCIRKWSWIRRFDQDLSPLP